MPKLLQDLRDRGFNILFTSHAEAILAVDFAEAMDELQGLLTHLRIPVGEFIRGGGGESRITQRVRRDLADLGWSKHKFQIEKKIDGVTRESISHEVDHVRRLPTGTLALEIEWNNKDPFFDRDLENFKRLHQEGAISAGLIITRGDSLHRRMPEFVQRFAERQGFASLEDVKRFGLKLTDRQSDHIHARLDRGRAFGEIWADAFTSDKYGEATTHWDKLMARVQRGVGNPCPLLLIGIPANAVDED